jgi:hypothetical protein
MQNVKGAKQTGKNNIKSEVQSRLFARAYNALYYKL